ncbi:MAG TPA: hypothetical protein VG755_42410 [Nannocystaceae bacterium]|nr:hypothetical protein [Nannocystaceae bacterium]
MAAMLLLGLVACDDVPAYETEQRQLGLMMNEFTGSTLREPLPIVDAVVGTRLCPHFDGWYERDGNAVTYHVEDGGDDSELRNCFALTASGAAHVDAECIVLDGPGDAAIELTPRTCLTQQQSGVEFTADRMPVASWAIDELVLRTDDPFVRSLASELSPGPGQPFPPLSLQDPAEPMRVIVGGFMLVMPMPFAKDDPWHVVGYARGFVRVVGEDARAELQNEVSAGGVSVVAGDRFALDLELAGGTLHGGEVIAVPGTDATSLELIVGYEPCETCELGWGQLAISQAILRDAEGHRLYAGDVDFHTEGFDVGEVYGDAMITAGICDEREGEVITGTVRAQFRDLAASADVQLECPVLADEHADDPEVVHDQVDEHDCEEGLFDCACDAGRSEHPTAALALLGLLALVRRRVTRP